MPIGGRAATTFRSKRRSRPAPAPDGPLEDRHVARARIKNCGPTRGRKRIHKIGMGSGKAVAKAKAAKKRG